MKTHIEKIMTIQGFCEMPREDSGKVFLFMMGKLLQSIVAGQQVTIADVDGKPFCDTYIAGITKGSDGYSKVHREVEKGEEVQLIVGSNYQECPELATKAKYLCAIVYDE